MDPTPPATPAPLGTAGRLTAGVADVAVSLFAPQGASTPSLDLVLGALTIGARRIDAIVGSTAQRLLAVEDRVAAVPVIGSVVSSMRERRAAVSAVGAAERATGRASLGALVRTAVDRVDMGAILDAIDVNAIVSHIDLDVVVKSIDIQAIIEKVDIAEIVAEIDVDDLIARTELGAIIAQSTSGVATQALDAVRSQTVGLDGFTERLVNRALRRRNAPDGPPLLVRSPPPEPEPDPEPEPTA